MLVFATSSKSRSRRRSFPKTSVRRQYVISANLMRRHMTGSQRAMLASDLEGYGHGGDRVSEDAERDAISQLARDEASDLAGISGRHTARAAKVKKQGIDEIAQAVRDGGINLNDAEPVVELPEDDQREALRGYAKVKQTTSEVR